LIGIEKEINRRNKIKMKVECIDATITSSNLTKGKIYDVIQIKTNEKCYILLDDDKDKVYCPTSCFKIVEEVNKTYTLIGILQKIVNNELKDDDIIKLNEASSKVKEFKRLRIPFEALKINGYTIKEKEYLTFDEARKIGKKFKHKNWINFVDINSALYIISEKYIRDSINEILDEKSWEVEE
jgi:hypothetical protein